MNTLKVIFDFISRIYQMGNNIQFFGVSLNGFLIGLSMFAILLPVALNMVKSYTSRTVHGNSNNDKKS